jgi:hypothetical protein
VRVKVVRVVESRECVDARSRSLVPKGAKLSECARGLPALAVESVSVNRPTDDSQYLELSNERCKQDAESLLRLNSLVLIWPSRTIR